MIILQLLVRVQALLVQVAQVAQVAQVVLVDHLLVQVAQVVLVDHRVAQVDHLLAQVAQVDHLLVHLALAAVEALAVHQVQVSQVVLVAQVVNLVLAQVKAVAVAAVQAFFNEDITVIERIQY